MSMKEEDPRVPILINSFIATTGMGFAMILPIIVGAIVDDLEFSRQMVGWIAAANIMGIGLGGMFTAMLIGRFSQLHILRISLVVLLLLDFASIFVSSEAAILLIRFLSGLAGGFVYGTAMAVFSGLNNSIKAFGLYVMTFCIMGAVITSILPSLIAIKGTAAGFLTLVVLSILSLAGTWFIRSISDQISLKTFVSLKFLLSKRTVALALLGYFLMQMSGGTIYAYVERIGKETGVSADFIGITLGLSYLISMAGGTFVFMLGDKRGLRFPILLGLGGLFGGMAILFWSSIPFLFLLGNCLFGISWSIVIPYFQQIQAQQDPHGKVVSFGTLVNMGGRAFGPAIAALILGSGSFLNVIWIGFAAVFLCAIVIWPLLRV